MKIALSQVSMNEGRSIKPRLFRAGLYDPFMGFSLISHILYRNLILRLTENRPKIDQ